MTSALSRRNSDDATDACDPSTPRAEVNLMPKDPDVAHELSIDLKQQMGFLRPPGQIEMDDAKRIGTPTEQGLLFSRG